MQLRFVPSESTDSYFAALATATSRCMVALRCVLLGQAHRLPSEQAGREGWFKGMTQFGRALAELNIEILCANSSQAKGRVERANRTLQDRLVKELRMAGVCATWTAGQRLSCQQFMEQYNEKFSVSAAKTENMHRRLNVQASRLG